MTSFLARGRAERFDTLVEGGRRDGVDQSTADLLELVGALRSTPVPHARPEFVADLRERLLVAAETELTPVRAARERDDVARLTLKPRRTHRERRISIAIGAVAILGASTSMAVASQNAIPGDALYPVKRAIENTKTGFRVSDDGKGEAILGNASVRLDEVDQLSQQKQPDATLVTQTLATFSAQATDASNHLLSDYEQNGDADSITALHGFTQTSMTQLTGLAAVVPAAAHGALEDAAQVLFAIDANATTVCPDCGTGLTELPAQLVTDAGQVLDGVTHALAGAGPTGSPGAGASGQPQQGQGTGKGEEVPSGLNPPETPIQLPAQPSASATTGVGGLLGGGAAGHGTGTAGTTSGTTNGTGNGNGGDGSDGGGKGGKGEHHETVDVTPVTTAVNQAVTGVVQGVTGLLAGLTGGLGSGR